MFKSRFIKKTRQRGDILLEALIGMLLLGIIGLGIVHVISRVSVSQKDMNVHNLVVTKLRTQLLAGDLVGIDPINAGTDRFTIKPHSENVTITIEGENVILSMNALSATKDNDSSYIICVGAISCDN